MKPLIFAQHAHDLRDAGLAVIPLLPADKEPEVCNFTKWRGRPSHHTIRKWCEKFPDANVGYVPGLSGLIMVDDDGGASDAITETFGDTPGKVRTRRGAHHLYRKPRADMLNVVDLRKYGINADLKHGKSIAVAPPSIHETGHVYEWQDCGPSVLLELPEFPVKALERLLDRRKAMSQDERKAAAGFRSGSRRLALNDYLVKHAVWCDTLGELIDCARTWNEQQQSARGIAPMDEAEVMQVSHGVWKDHEAGKLRKYHGRKAIIKSSGDEIEELAKFGKDAPQAYMLLMKLRAEHGGRMARSETFAISDRAMAKAQVLPHWSRYDYVKARDILLDAGKIEIADAAKNSSTGRKATQFRLVVNREAA